MTPLLAAFWLCQVLDGILTYIGVMRYGIAIEANPLAHFFMVVAGVLPTIVCFKAMGMLFSLLLRYSRRVLIVAIACYLVFAVLPWTWLLFLS